MQANNNPSPKLGDTLDKWAERREKEREALPTLAEQLAHVEADNALLSEILAEAERLFAKIKERGTIAKKS